MGATRRSDLERAWRTRDKAVIRAHSIVVPIFLGTSVRIPLDWGGTVIDYLRDSTGDPGLGLGDIWYRDLNEAKWRAHHKAEPGTTSILFEATYRPGQLAKHNEYVVKIEGLPIVTDCLVLHNDGTWRSQTSLPATRRRTPKLKVVS